MKTYEKIAQFAAQRVPASRIVFTAAMALLAANTFGTPPSVVSVTPNAAGTELYVKFNQSLCTSTPGTTHIPNYSVSGAAGGISAATLMGDAQTVRLDLAPAVAGTHSLTVSPLPNFPIYDGGCLGSSNTFLSQGSISFTVTGTVTGPEAYWANPDTISADCGSTVTVHGSHFDSDATLTLIPASGGSPISGVSPLVSGGTTITATIPGGLPPGSYSVMIRNPNGSLPNESVPFPLPVSGVKLTASWPYYPGNCGQTEVTVSGSGFCPGTTIVATPPGSGTPVVGTSVHINAAGNQLSAIFDFSSSPSSPYDLTVQNPGGTSDTLIQALWVGDLTAWTLSLPKYVGNCAAMSATLDGNFCQGDEVRLSPVSGGSPVFGNVTAINPGTYLYGKRMMADFNFYGATPGEYRVELRHSGGNWTQPIDYLRTFVMDPAVCPTVTEFVGRTRVGYTKVNHFAIKVYNVSCGSVSPNVTVSFPTSDDPQFSNYGSGLLSAPNTLDYTISFLAAGQMNSLEFDLLLPHENTTATLAANNSICGSITQPMDVVHSQDPNAKSGLAGNGTQHVIVGNEVLPYEIHFENMPTASAPAQDVFITDHLNPAQFDLSTFSLGEITFGNRTITPPPGLTSFSQTVPLDLDSDPATTADQVLLVVKAALVTDANSPDYGRLTWSYRTLDPVTLDAPTDVMLGFLPPNKLSPMGEGSVKFNVKLKPSLASGTQMGSAAVIVFDANVPLSTNPWFNQLASPVPLVIRRVGASVQVEWTAPAGLFTLEQSTQLGADAAWTTVGTSPVTMGSLQRITTSASGPQRYFRLRL